jgi:protein O-mannosyl-transferase
VKAHEPGRNRKAKNRGVRPPADKALQRTPSPYTRHALAAFALCALTLLAYSNSFEGGLVLDNKVLLLDPRIRDATPENIALIFHHTYWWPTGEAGLYRPFTTLSYLFNYAVLGEGDQLFGYHAINLLLHLGNVLLAYMLALRLVRRFWPSVFIAAVWAVHPASTESVTNIVGRADLLAAMAVLSGFLMYLESREASEWARGAWLAGLMAVTTIGVFSKESAVAILPVIILYELVIKKGTDDISGRRRILKIGLPEMSSVPFWGCAAALVPIVAMLWKRSAVLAASPPAEFPFADNPIVGADWWTGRLTAIQVIARYLWLMIWPANLSCDYSFDQIPLARGSAADWFAFVIVFAAAIGVVLVFRWNRTAFFLACFAFFNFAPASNLFFPIGTIMADRLLYLSSLGLLACLVLAIYPAAEKPKFAMLAPLVLCLIISGFAVRTWIRNQDWQTELALATHDVRVSPRSYKLHQLLAASLFESDPSHSNIDQVIEEQGKSVALLDPLPDALSRPETYRQAGYYHLLKGDLEHDHAAVQSTAAYRSALQALERCISIDQASRASYLSQAGSKSFSSLIEGDAQAYLLLSLVYLRLGDSQKAYGAINRARTLDPLNPQMYRQLSAVLAQQGRNDQAEVALMQETAITSLREGKWQDAADSSGRVLQVDSAGYPSAFYLNAMADLRLGNLDAAEKSAREAIRLDTAHRNPRTSYVLGLVLAEKQEYGQAIDSLNVYLRAAPNAPDSETVRKQLSNIERLAKSQAQP